MVTAAYEHTCNPGGVTSILPATSVRIENLRVRVEADREGSEHMIVRVSETIEKPLRFSGRPSVRRSPVNAPAVCAGPDLLVLNALLGIHVVFKAPTTPNFRPIWLSHIKAPGCATSSSAAAAGREPPGYFRGCPRVDAAAGGFHGSDRIYINI
ncbi:hypothetical protein EVAR_93509_1 [Eumeta japonica]|uniref:Uncharacterized protein n=1 Tax=Eumeta variegata TaxID=151549 RepID=A0A4C1TMK4_EUMVA|nr:hypothetical protein EVAR_93509_1 [Eumeta japonica]